MASSDEQQNQDENTSPAEKITIQSLPDSNAQFQAVWNMAIDAIITIDERGVIKSANPAAKRIFGYTLDEMLGKNVLMLMPPEEGAQHDGYLRDYLRTGQGNIIGIGREVTAVRKNGELFPIDLAVSELETEGHRLFTGVLRDITTRKKTEVALRSERDFAESLVETAHAIVLVLDTQENIVRFNPFLEELSGYNLEDVRGKNWFETFQPQRDIQQSRDLFSQTMGGSTVQGNINPIITHAGLEIEISWWAKSLKDVEENVTGVLYIGHDISDLRKAQRQVVQSERLAAIGQMMTGLAHESRNALQRVQACLDMLELDIGEDSGSELLDLTQRGRAALDEADRLYEEVRSYAAPVQLEITAVDLTELWRTVWSHLADTHRLKSLQLIEKVEGDNFLCQIDRHKTEQVIRNILENAIAVCGKFGEVVVTCADADMNGRDGVRISIHDNGPGFDESQKQRIFDPFFTTKPKGTGLGMAIAKRLVEAHEGTIVVGDSPPPGGEIVVCIPKEQK